MPVFLRLPDDVEARLTNLATRTGRSKTFYATEAICEHLDDPEDLYLAGAEGSPRRPVAHHPTRGGDETLWHGRLSCRLLRKKSRSAGYAGRQACPGLSA